MTDQNTKNEHEGHFYKGLFFGLLIGVGVIWFLNSEGGKEIVKTARRKIDEALAEEPGAAADYEFEDEEVGSSEETTAKSASNPRRFFQKKSK